MAIEDVRQRRLRDLLQQKYKTKAALAEALGVAPSYISRLLSPEKNRKRLKEDLARKMETAAGLPHLFFDRDDNAAAIVAPPSSWPFSFPKARIEKLAPRDREKIDEAIKIMLSLCEESGLSRAHKKRAA